MHQQPMRRKRTKCRETALVTRVWNAKEPRAKFIIVQYNVLGIRTLISQHITFALIQAHTTFNSTLHKTLSRQTKASWENGIHSLFETRDVVLKPCAAERCSFVRTANC